MRNHIVSFLMALIFNPAFAMCSAQWTCSTADHPWASRQRLVAIKNDENAFGTFIAVDSHQTFQTIDGWGGCFNERGWKAMSVLSVDDRQTLLKNLFSNREGLNLSLCRAPIGSSDYAISLYSLDETPGDFAMDHFSIDRDRQMLIPYVKAAMAIRPDLKIWGVPWSPPAWMKDSNVLTGGHIKDDDKTLDALALYFVRYVQAYQALGLPLYMVMPQNEPSYSTNYSSCQWNGRQLAKFIGRHLGPVFKQRHLDCQIYLGTLARSDPENYVESVTPSLDDPATSAFITGLGLQWGGDQNMRDTRFLHPEKKLMQTENECGAKNTNDWAFAEHQFDRARVYFDAGANASMIWNIVLDETGKSTAGWAQCSPVVVDQTTRKVIYTPYYYCYRHFSAFVQPGAKRIAIEGGWGDKLAFLNPDGQVVVILANTAKKDHDVAIRVDGRTIKATMPAHSFNTFSIDPES